MYTCSDNDVGYCLLYVPLFAGGWTTTAYALYFTYLMLNPAQGYGSRPYSQGIPKVAVLLTDGRSNIYPIHEIAPVLRNAGVQVHIHVHVHVHMHTHVHPHVGVGNTVYCSWDIAHYQLAQ